MDWRAHWPVVGGFGWFGAISGSLAISALDVQESLGLGPGGFGALLALGFALGAGAQLAGGRSVEHGGEVCALRRAMLLTVVTVVAVAIAPPTIPSAIAVLALLTAAGALNATVNAGAAIATDGEPRGFVQFHACFSAGAVMGAVVAAGVDRAGASWRVVFLVVGAVGSVVVAASARTPTTAPAMRTTSPRSLRSIAGLLRTVAVRDAAILLCFAVAAAGAVDTWGVRYLRIDRGASVVGGAAAYATGQLVAAVARLRLVPNAATRSSRPIVIAAAALAVGLVVERTASMLWLAGVGLALAAVAAALVVPLLLAQGGRGARPAATIAAMGAVGQLGFVVGPVLIGTATSLADSGTGLLLAAAFAACAAVGAARRLPVDGADAVSDVGAAMKSASMSEEM